MTNCERLPQPASIRVSRDRQGPVVPVALDWDHLADGRRELPSRGENRRSSARHRHGNGALQSVEHYQQPVTRRESLDVANVGCSELRRELADD